MTPHITYNAGKFKELIGQYVIDVDGSYCRVMNATSNSIEVEFKRKTVKGIDCTNWFTEQDFIKRFTIKENS